MMKEYKPGDIILDDWTLTKTLGKGSYGSVYQIERSIPGKKDKETIMTPIWVRMERTIRTEDKVQ